MTCQRLTDKMPAVASRRLDWSPEEAAHLADCTDCAAEWRVVRAGAGVGQGVTVDADAVAVRVLQRLRSEPVVRPWKPLRWVAGLAAAAAVVALLWPGRAPRPSGTELAAPTALTVEVPGLDALSEEGLGEVLESMDAPWADVPTMDSPSLHDLDVRELEWMDRNLET